MRILHVTDGYRPHVGGIEVFVEDLAWRQAAAGHEVSVLTATAGDTSPSTVSLEADPVRVLRTPPTLLHPLAPPAARDAALTGRYDVVHAHLSVLSMFATTVARATDEAGIPTVNTAHSMWGGRRTVVQGVRLLADWNRANIAWTTVSHAAAADMVGLLPAGTTVRVVPNAVDVGWWRAGMAASRAPGTVTFVSVMRLARRKRPFALLSMLEQARARVPGDAPLRALIVGDGPLIHRMQAEVAGRRLSSWVTLVGRCTRQEIRALYADADVYVSPAYQESFGIAALEARAAGLPVVAMRAGGVGEFVEHGVEGLLCRDDQDMASALARLAVATRSRAAIAAYNRAHPPLWDWPRVIDGFDRVYASARNRNEELRRRSAARTVRR